MIVDCRYGVRVPDGAGTGADPCYDIALEYLDNYQYLWNKILEKTPDPLVEM
jgi:hypothetical protein